MSEFEGWIANLSSGETVIEEPPAPGEYTAWRKLIYRCAESGEKVTGLQLRRGDVLVSALPVGTCQGYYHAYEAIISMQGRVERKMQGIGSVVGEYVYITWILLDDDDIDTIRVFQEVRLLSESMEHVII